MNKNHEEVEYELMAKTFAGLEDVLATELLEIGAKDVEPGRRMVRFRGDKKILYKANIHLRTALRVLKLIKTFTIKDQDDYYTELSQINWEDYMGLHHSFAIDAVVSSEIFKNSLFAAQRAKDAIVDSFRAKYHKRPMVDVQNPDVQINIHISGNKINLSLDSSGASLHKRGYRTAEGEAPINQVLAAAIIRMSGWSLTTPFVDPMTGSGTLAIEAAMIARNMPPGLIRKSFCFKNWPDYDKKLYNQIMEEIELNDIKTSIFANDISADVLEIARTNALKANVTSMVRFSNKTFEEYKPKAKSGTIIINPPYGERMKQDEIFEFYAGIGNALKGKYAGFQAWIISSNLEALKRVGLKPNKKIKLYNGSLDCLLCSYELFDGALKDFKTTEKNKT